MSAKQKDEDLEVVKTAILEAVATGKYLLCLWRIDGDSLILWSKARDFPEVALGPALDCARQRMEAGQGRVLTIKAVPLKNGKFGINFGKHK